MWSSRGSPRSDNCFKQGSTDQAEGAAASLRGDLVRAAAPPSAVLDASDVLVAALVLNGHGAGAAARDLASQTLAARATQAGPDDPSLVPTLLNYGAVFLQRGEFSAAVAPVRRAVLLLEGARGADSLGVADALNRLGIALLWSESWSEGLVVVERALRIKESLLDISDPRIAPTLIVQGELLQRVDEHRRAAAVLRRAVEIQDAHQTAAPEAAQAMSLLGEELWYLGDLGSAKTLCDTAISLARANLRPGHPEIAVVLRRLALTEYNLGDPSGLRL